MNDKIQITKDLKFDFCDLMLPVDFSVKFTLKDILNAIQNSKVPSDILKMILRCNFIDEYVQEVNLKDQPKRNDGCVLEYLELYWCGDEMNRYKNFKKTKEIQCDSYIGFHGRGVGEDGRDENFAIEFSPLYEMADLEIRACDKMAINKIGVPKEPFEKIDFSPTLNLIEVLYAIIYELSFMGNIKDRDSMKKELLSRIENIKTGKEKMIPWEDVKKRLNKTIKNIRKKKKK